MAKKPTTRTTTRTRGMKLHEQPAVGPAYPNAQPASTAVDGTYTKRAIWCLIEQADQVLRDLREARDTGACSRSRDEQIVGLSRALTDATSAVQGVADNGNPAAASIASSPEFAGFVPPGSGPSFSDKVQHLLNNMTVQLTATQRDADRVKHTLTLLVARGQVHCPTQEQIEDAVQCVLAIENVERAIRQESGDFSQAYGQELERVGITEDKADTTTDNTTTPAEA